MENLVTILDGNVVVSSRDVAERFGKAHKDVLRHIEDVLRCIPQNVNIPTMYKKVSYVHEQNGQTYPYYLMNRDGFDLLVMGFTGAKTLEWKLKYIKAFNAMEKELNNIRLDVIRKETKRNVRNTIMVHCNNPFVLKREKDDVFFRDSWFRQNQFVKNEPMKAIQ